jgi:hypothetical protein
MFSMFISASLYTLSDSEIKVETAQAVGGEAISTEANLSTVSHYTPTHCQDRKQANLRWIHRRLLQQLGRRRRRKMRRSKMLNRVAQPRTQFVNPRNST